MPKFILISEKQQKQSTVLRAFHHDLGSLIRIRGFTFIKYFDNSGHLSALDWFSFSRNDVLFTLKFDHPNLPVLNQIESHLEEILRELSIFQLIDVFLFDELGIVEPFIPRLQQQLITIFSSKYTVIACANQNNINKLTYLKKVKNIEYHTLTSNDTETFYLKLIEDLYDR